MRQQIVYGVKVETFFGLTSNSYIEFELYNNISVAWDAAYGAMEDMYSVGNYDIEPLSDNRTIVVKNASGKRIARAQVVQFALNEY